MADARIRWNMVASGVCPPKCERLLADCAVPDKCRGLGYDHVMEPLRGFRYVPAVHYRLSRRTHL